jgi:hypothetical protein
MALTQKISNALRCPAPKIKDSQVAFFDDISSKLNPNATSFTNHQISNAQLKEFSHLEEIEYFLIKNNCTVAVRAFPNHQNPNSKTWPTQPLPLTLSTTSWTSLSPTDWPTLPTASALLLIRLIAVETPIQPLP